MPKHQERITINIHIHPGPTDPVPNHTLSSNRVLTSGESMLQHYLSEAAEGRQGLYGLELGFPEFVEDELSGKN